MTKSKNVSQKDKSQKVIENTPKVFRTIKEMCKYYLGIDFGQEKYDLEFYTKQALEIKNDSKFNKYHLSYWKSKFRSELSPKK